MYPVDDFDKSNANSDRPASTKVSCGRIPRSHSLPVKATNPNVIEPNEDASEKTLPIGLMNYNGWRAGARTGSDPAIYQTYIETMGRFVNSLLDRGYRVRLLTGETVDMRAVRDIGRIAEASGYELIDGTLPPPKRQQLVTEPINSLHDVMRQISDTDIVVATRFHNVVCALKLARPTISIGYEFKNDAVMTDLGLGEFCQKVDDLDLELLQKHFTELLENREHYQTIIRKRLDDVRSRVRRHEQELLSKIL